MTVDEALKVVDHRRSSWMSVDEVTGVLHDEVRRLQQQVKHLEGMLGNSESMACYYNHQFMRIQQRVWELEAAAHELRDTVLNEHDGLEVNYVLDLIDSTIGEVIEPTKPSAGDEDEAVQSLAADPEEKAEVDRLMRKA